MMTTVAEIVDKQAQDTRATAQKRFDAAFSRSPRFDPTLLNNTQAQRVTDFFSRNAVFLIRQRMRIENKVARVLIDYASTQMVRISEIMTRLDLWDELADDAATLFLALRLKGDSDKRVQAKIQEHMRTNKRVDDHIRQALRQVQEFPLGSKGPLFGDLDGLLTTAYVLFAESGGRFVKRQIKAVADAALLDAELIQRQARGTSFTPTDAMLVELLFGEPDHTLLQMIEEHRFNPVKSAILTQAQFDDMRTILRQALYENVGGALGARAIARELAEKFGDRLRSGHTPQQIEDRMMLWARTEGTIIQNDSLLLMGKEAGMDGKRWDTVGDNKVRPGHVANEGDGTIPVNDVFADGSVDGGSGSVSPFACRCAVGGAILPKKSRT